MPQLPYMALVILHWTASARDDPFPSLTRRVLKLTHTVCAVAVLAKLLTRGHCKREQSVVLAVVYCWSVVLLTAQCRKADSAAEAVWKALCIFTLGHAAREPGLMFSPLMFQCVSVNL